MYTEFHTAGKGLRTMFIGEIISFLSIFLAWIPLLGSVAAVAGSVIVLIGLNTTGSAHPGYKNAMYMVIAGIVLSILNGIFQEGIFAWVVVMAAAVVGFLETYYICFASGELLSAKGDEYQASRANLIWKLYAVSSLVVIACNLVSWIPVINVLAAIAAVVAAIVSAVAGILYLIFLYKASQSLLA